MKKSSLKALAAASLLPLATGAQASLWEDIIDTTPAGAVRASAERPGDWKSFWADTTEGFDFIMKNGSDTLVLPLYTNHPTWAWDNRHEENGWPMGGGLARKLIDDKGNERMFFAVAFVDSNYRIEPIAGYAWFARYPIGSSGLNVGAGYIAGITMRGDYMWAPLPLPLPAAKIGFKNVDFYGTWIPFTNVGFFFSSITIDNQARRLDPHPASSPWVKTPNFLYGTYGWQYADNGGDEYSPSTVKNDASWGAGLRRYSGRSWQTDLKYKKVEHEVMNAATGKREGADFETVALTIAYNIDATPNFRMFAGAGFGWSQMKSSAGRDDNIHPVTTIGFTWAFSDRIHLTGSMDTSYSRFKGTTPGRSSDYVMKPMPTDFNLGLGVAF